MSEWDVGGIIAASALVYLGLAATAARFLVRLVSGDDPDQFDWMMGSFLGLLTGWAVLPALVLHPILRAWGWVVRGCPGWRALLALHQQRRLARELARKNQQIALAAQIADLEEWHRAWEADHGP